MNTQSRLFRRIAALGIVFSVLFVVAMFLNGNGEATNASGAAVIRYYQSHRASETAAVFVMAVAAISFTFFLASLRRALGLTSEGRQLAPVVTAGGAIYVGGLLVGGLLILALVDAAHDQMTAVVQTINVLSSDDWVPVVVGLSVVALGTGVAALRSGGLPRWLSWASIGLGLLAIAGPLGALAFLITPLWTLVIAIVLLRQRTLDRAPETAGSAVSAMTGANK